MATSTKLLLCFIHGFKGGNETFGAFPSHLKNLLQPALPKVTILTTTYPQFETRGNLHECVRRFRKWLQAQVRDLDGTTTAPSPSITSAVRTILVGHSMGGIVAAETLLAILAERPACLQPNSQPRTDHSSLVAPYIQGILAFDTPYLGVALNVVARSAEQHWDMASSVYSVCSHLAVALGWGSQDVASVGMSKMLLAPSASSTADTAGPPWWGHTKPAMFAAAVGAIIAGGAAAYTKKAQITQGVTWVTSHLEFVGVLARPEEMQTRLEKIAKLTGSQGLGFCNLYTTLGQAGDERTFCILPTDYLRAFFTPTVNGKAGSETWAHMSMFEPDNNPGYDALSETARDKIAAWVKSSDWYRESGRKQADKEDVETIKREGEVPSRKRGSAVAEGADGARKKQKV